MKSKNFTRPLNNPPFINSSACIVGPKEGEGPMKETYDLIVDDEYWAEDTWEKSESKFVKETYRKIIKKANISNKDIDCIVCGDLLNQSIASSFGLRNEKVSLLGVYGACSTMAESMIVGSMMVSSGIANNIVCMTSSHFCSAEKQFRFPLELGNQRTPTSQRTVTGSGGVLLSDKGQGPRVSRLTVGKIVDMGISDTNNMGAAMAPAAADTLASHFQIFSPDDYDYIYTGDLGIVGRDICNELIRGEGYNIDSKYKDCGELIYSSEQDAHAGGSGCGCSAVILAGHILNLLKNGDANRILFVGTGALLSPTSSLQGETIPSIAHAVCIER